MVSIALMERRCKNKGSLKGGAKYGPSSSDALTQGPYYR